MRSLLLLFLCAALCACGRTGLVEWTLTDEPAPEDAGVDAGFDAGLDAGVDAGVDAGELEVAASLQGLRWELPCVAPYTPAPEHVCISGPDQTTTATLTGRVGTTYELTLRLRGVVETKAYPGGVGAPVSLGGTPVNDAWNIYRLDISSPAQRWFLNAGETGVYACRIIDERLTVRAAAFAQFTLFASTVDSNRSEIRNRDLDGGALVVPSLPMTPYDGQFLQLDVEAVHPVP